MIPPVDLAAFKVDIRNAPTPERRTTIVKIWTATICNHLRIGNGGYRAREIRDDLEETVRELGLTLGEEP